MFTLRCTARLLKRLKVGPEAGSAPPSTLLGDWYAHLLFLRQRHLVLCVSERTLLPALVPARDLKMLLPRIERSVCDVLLAIGVSEEAVQEEKSAMAAAVIGQTASRQVLGSMNDFVKLVEPHLQDRGSLLDLALQLADTPCGPLQMDSPRQATLKLFSMKKDEF